MDKYTVVITTELSTLQASKLAEFIKRVNWNEIRQNATGDDEADLMHQALLLIGRSLEAVNATQSIR